MKTAVQDRYGSPDVLRIESVPQPVPGVDEVLVRVHASTVTQTDCHMRRARPLVWRLMLGWRRPRRRTLGLDVAGEVVDVGSDASAFEVGERIFGRCSGAHAEYVCVKGSGLLAPIPAGLTFEEAATLCDGFHQGLTCLRAADVREGQRVLVYGASGSCGTACVQLARYFGAHVTAVCNGRNAELVRSLGADEVIDYEREDFTRNGRLYDAVIDAVGKRRSYLRNRRALAPGGVFVPTDGLHNVALSPLTSRLGKKRMRFLIGKWTMDDLLFLCELVEAGHYRPVVDRAYPLEQVAEAHRYVESWQKVGNVVLTVNGGSS